MLRSFAICNSIEKNHLHEHGVSEPMVKALVRGLASSSACTTTGDLSGCQVARVKSTRVWSLIYFLNMFKGYSTMKWFVSAWTIWGLRAEWTLNMGTEASKGLTLLWLCAGRPLGFVFDWRNDKRELVQRIFCGDGGCKTLTISQDRQNMYLFWELFRLWSWKIAGPVLRLHAMCRNWIIGFKRGGVFWSWGASKVLKIQGLVKCWHFVKFGLCVTFDEIKNSTPEGILMIF